LNLSVIWITHNLPVLAEICDKIVVMYAGKSVESDNVRSLIKNPKHPYSKGLLDSFPNIDDPNHEIRPIKGTPPDLINPPSGCKFHPRCPHQKEICREVQPKRESKNKEGFIECHLWKQI
jgi:oligopeptide/dipeptide ABC transporter ATP-binding protein